MYRNPGRAPFGPHSIHDARQYAFSLLIFGPGAPAPRHRVHAGTLPDVYVGAPDRHPSLFSRLVALIHRAPRPSVSIPDEGGAQDTETGHRPDKENTRDQDRLAA